MASLNFAHSAGAPTHCAVIVLAALALIIFLHKVLKGAINVGASVKV